MTIFKYEDSKSKTISVDVRKALADQIKADIDAYCLKEFTDEHRNHLGASLIGKECSREIWYDFRWVKYQVWEPRMLRLFNRGKMEEELFIKWLRAIGCQIWEVDPQTNKQFRIWGVNGHYGGSADSVGILPQFPDLPMLLEFKTHHSKSFINLINNGLIKSKYQHYSQMCSYGKHYNFKYGLYFAVNKNDDDHYIEIVELDHGLASNLTNKAQYIIESQTPPPRVSQNPSYYTCKFCNKHDICWSNKPVEINCRSCKSAVPVEDAKWNCTRFNNIIPPDFIKKGCEYHDPINT